MLYEHGYNRVVLDRRACGSGTTPAVSDLCSSVLCPLYSASSSGGTYCAQQCRSQCNTPLSTGPLYLMVWNTGESGPTLLDLQFSLLASCSATLPCPAPLPALGACAGAGTCVAGAGAAMPKCSCTGGPDANTVWGDVGCDAPLRVLQPGVPLLNQTLPYGQWAYYTFDAVANLPLQLMLTRSNGDPLLLLKNASAPPVPGGVPTLEDYYASADTLSFTAAGNTAYRISRRWAQTRRRRGASSQPFMQTTGTPSTPPMTCCSANSPRLPARWPAAAAVAAAPAAACAPTATRARRVRAALSA